ncbi:uncharacterized protein [Panulirus ornatus]|uniref:uncharacterized protein n=1 Tax=Panulirus ornatus TaxID=150431 RepID=UPI003A88A313
MVQLHMRRSLPLIVVAMATVTLAAFVGPQNRRYPDYIVYPMVECVERGVFPHPRNCSWYYRCEDIIRTGFFRRYYFECEPGTVFSDEMDQCLYPTQVRPPCGTNPEPGLTLQPGGSTPQPVGSTTQSGGVSPFTFCSYSDDICKKYEVCNPTRETLDLCSGCIMSSAFINASSICSQENHVLNREKNTCESPPEESRLCPSTAGSPGILPTITSNNNLDCSDDNLRPQENWILANHCKDYPLCDSDGFFQVMRNLCEDYFECHREADNSWGFQMKNCDEGQLFSFEEDACVSRPLDSELCPTSDP